MTKRSGLGLAAGLYLTAPYALRYLLTRIYQPPPLDALDCLLPPRKDTTCTCSSSYSSPSSVQPSPTGCASCSDSPQSLASSPLSSPSSRSSASPQPEADALPDLWAAVA